MESRTRPPSSSSSARWDYGATRCAYVPDNPAKDFVAPHRLGWRTVRVRRMGSLRANAPSGDDIDAEITSLDDLDTALAWDDFPTSNHTTNDFHRGIAPSE